jgi:hypothetical protein
VVQAERRERRPAAKPDAAQGAIDALRAADPIGYVDGDGTEGEFVLLVARREADGRLAILAPVASDPSLMERALRKAACKSA